jgi:hypothetical protein
MLNLDTCLRSEVSANDYLDHQHHHIRPFGIFVFFEGKDILQNGMHVM